MILHSPSFIISELKRLPTMYNFAHWSAGSEKVLTRWIMLAPASQTDTVLGAIQK